MIDGDEISYKVKLSHAFELWSFKKSGLPKNFPVSGRTSKQTPDDICSVVAKMRVCEMKKKFSRSQEVGINQKVNNCSEAKTPFVQQSNHEIAQPAIIGRDGKNSISG